MVSLQHGLGGTGSHRTAGPQIRNFESSGMPATFEIF